MSTACVINPLSLAENVLNSTFGYQSFRPGQDAVIGAILDNRDCLVLMPTGGGKSLCYQVPALVKEGVTLVVSPLISLMKDQVDQLRLHGVNAACLNSSQTSQEQRQIIERCSQGK